MTVVVVTVFGNVHAMVLPPPETHQSKMSRPPVRTRTGYLSLPAVPPSAVAAMDLDFCSPLAHLHSQISYHAFLALTPHSQSRRPIRVSPRDIRQQRLILAAVADELSLLAEVKQDGQQVPLPLTVHHHPLIREAAARSAEVVAPVDMTDTLRVRLASCLKADC